MDEPGSESHRFKAERRDITSPRVPLPWRLAVAGIGAVDRLSATDVSANRGNAAVTPQQCKNSLEAMTQFGRDIMKRIEQRRLLAVLLVTVWLGAASATPAETLDGETLFNHRTCVTCHGKDGKTPILPEYPIIAGQNAAYILQQLKDIKSGARANGNSASMRGIMHLVDEEEMKALAEYISKLER